ncbi:hypothetical protein V8E36_005077 [Tilletia maclaganii]
MIDGGGPMMTGAKDGTSHALVSRPAVTSAQWERLRLRCSLPASLVQNVRALAADGSLATALRSSSSSSRPDDNSGEIRDAAAAAEASSGVLVHSADGATTGTGGDGTMSRFTSGSRHDVDPDPDPADNSRDDDDEEENQNEDDPGSPRKRRRQRTNLSTASVGHSAPTAASIEREGPRRASKTAVRGGNAALKLLSQGQHADADPAAVALNRLTAFQATLPPAFRSITHTPDFTANPAESAIIQPIPTRKLVSISRPTPEPTSSARTGSRPAESAKDDRIIRISVLSHHASGGRRKLTGPDNVPTVASTSSNSARVHDLDPEEQVSGPSSKPSAGSGAPGTPAQQHIELPSSTTLATLGCLIICPTRRLPISSSAGPTAVAPDDDGLDAAASVNFIVADSRVYLSASCTEEERQASVRVCQKAGLLPGSVSEQGAIASGELEDVEIGSLPSLRTGQRLYMLHCGGTCSHLITITQINTRTATDPPRPTYPRHLSVPHAALRNPLMSMMIKKRFHAHVLSPMICGICELWPGQAILLGGADFRVDGRGRARKVMVDMAREEDDEGADGGGRRLRGLGEEALVCCAGCWEACGGALLSGSQDQTQLSQKPIEAPRPPIEEAETSPTRPNTRRTSARNAAAAARKKTKKAIEAEEQAVSIKGRGGRGKGKVPAKTQDDADVEADSPTSASVLRDDEAEAYAKAGVSSRKRKARTTDVKEKLKIAFAGTDEEDGGEELYDEGDDRDGWGEDGKDERRWIKRATMPIL